MILFQFWAKRAYNLQVGMKKVLNEQQPEYNVLHSCVQMQQLGNFMEVMKYWIKLQINTVPHVCE